MLMGAIVLVDDDGVLNISHQSMLECDSPDKPIARPPPWLDPQSVLRPGELCITHRHILHPILVVALPQTPNATNPIHYKLSRMVYLINVYNISCTHPSPYAVAGAARDAVDDEAHRAWADGDAVIAGLDVGIEDGDAGWALDMDAIGVGAVSSSLNPHSLHLAVGAFVQHQVG